MRPIQPREECLTASDIAERFFAEEGVGLHPTNVGNAAKALGLDYLETHDADGRLRKLYAIADLPQIFDRLRALAKRRLDYEMLLPAQGDPPTADMLTGEVHFPDPWADDRNRLAAQDAAGIPRFIPLPKKAMTRDEYLMRRWKLALDRLRALGRKRGTEFQLAAFWVAMWGSCAMAAKGITRFPADSERQQDKL